MNVQASRRLAIHAVFLLSLLALIVVVARAGGLWPSLMVVMVGGVLYSVLRTLFPLSPKD